MIWILIIISALCWTLVATLKCLKYERKTKSKEKGEQ